MIALYVLYGNIELKRLQKVHSFCLEEDVILLVFLQSYSLLYYPHDSKLTSTFLLSEYCAEDFSRAISLLSAKSTVWSSCFQRWETWLKCKNVSFCTKSAVHFQVSVAWKNQHIYLLTGAFRMHTCMHTHMPLPQPASI